MYSFRELSRFGRESAFPEKKSYVPNVRIEYVDDSGRVLNTKEAFRYMSHKFHGRGSGRKKLEKRLKKYQDEHVRWGEWVWCGGNGYSVTGWGYRY